VELQNYKVFHIDLVKIRQTNPLSKTVVVLKLGASEAGAACRRHADGHSAGCRIARETLRSAETSFRITGLALRRAAVIFSRNFPESY